jgi:hypothetical protein
MGPPPHRAAFKAKAGILITGKSMNGSIFISYRRDDDSAFVGRLYDYLERDFTAKRLFIDIENIKGGQDFPTIIDEKVAQSDVLLAVIGNDWVSLTDEKGHRRLDDKDDFLRLEIESALKRNKRIIPVLIGDAKMPTAQELPTTLIDLTRKQAVVISNVRFRSDYLELSKSIKKALEEAAQERNINKSVWKNRCLMVGFIVAVALFMFGNITQDWRANVDFTFSALILGFFLIYYIFDLVMIKHVPLGRMGKNLILWSMILIYFAFIATAGSAMLIGRPEFQFQLLGMPPVPICRPVTALRYSCGAVADGHIISNVAWNDTDRGLNVRDAPSVTGKRLGTIPSNAVEIPVEKCEAGWCAVTCKSVKGWSRDKYLKNASDSLTGVTNISPTDPVGLTARNGPSPKCGPTGQLPYDAKGVITHSCQIGPDDKGTWCQITYEKLSGWVPSEFLRR